MNFIGHTEFGNRGRETDYIGGSPNIWKDRQKGTKTRGGAHKRDLQDMFS